MKNKAFGKYSRDRINIDYEEYGKEKLKVKWMTLPFSIKFIGQTRTDSILDMYTWLWYIIHVVKSSVKLTVNTKGLEEASRLKIEI